MKKLALVLVWFLIAGWAIFAIQSYASSQDGLPTEAEIADLKSTNPKNNNRLSAEMWDKMLDLLNRTRGSVSENISSNHSSSEQNNIEVWDFFSTCAGSNLNCNNEVENAHCYRGEGGYPCTDDMVAEYNIKKLRFPDILLKEQASKFYKFWRNPLNYNSLDYYLRRPDARSYFNYDPQNLRKSFNDNNGNRLDNWLLESISRWDLEEDVNRPEFGFFTNTQWKIQQKSTKVIDHVTNKETFTFCALSAVASENGKHICEVTPWKKHADGKYERYLYENWENDGFCSVTCF